MALLRYFESVRPSVLVLMGRVWRERLREAGSFWDVPLAEDLARLRREGVRVYLLDAQQRGNTRIGLPGGQALELRRELRLRIEGRWVWFGDRGLLESPMRRLLAWARRLRGAGAVPVDRLAGLHGRVAAATGSARVDAVVVADREPALRTVVGESGGAYTVASPGYWRDGHRALESLFGRWALRSAGGRAASGADRGERERLWFGPLTPAGVTLGK